MTIAESEAADEGAFDGPLLALWWDAHADWNRAHEVAQDIGTADGAWVHAHLHRKEGQASNASYWYARAGRPLATGGLREEWEQIVEDLLQRRKFSGARR